MRVATYNIHGCVGVDGRYDPLRVARVIRELDADVVALQEVDTTRGIRYGIDLVELFERETSMHMIFGSTVDREHGAYGNAVLSAHPVVDVCHYDITCAEFEPRGTIDVELDIDGHVLRLLATHFGLARRERREQFARLVSFVEPPPIPDVTVVAGDLNEWIPLGSGPRMLDRLMGASRGVRSFPSRAPVLRLDRVWVKPRRALQLIRAHRSPLARIASDHLPVVTEIALG